MNAKKKENKEVKINFRIVEIRKIGHYERDYTEYGLSVDDLKRAKGKVQLLFKIIDEEGCLAFIVKSSFECIKDKKSYELFNVEVLYKFEIKDFNEVFETSKEGDVMIPDDFLRTLIGMAISGARGIQAVVVTNAEYKDMLIPLLNAREVLRGLKGNS